MRPYSRILLVFLALLLLLGIPQGARGQTDIQVTSHADYTFGEQILFEASIQSSAPIQEVTIVFQSESQLDTVSGIMTLEGGAQAFYSHDLTQRSMPPFSKIFYWYHVTLQNGETVTSPSFSFFYADNRFAWETLEGGPFRVHWYEGDIPFAQMVLDTAQRGVQQTQDKLALPAPLDIDIYVYSKISDLQTALPIIGSALFAGHASPERGLVMLSLTPNDSEGRVEMERQVPHEIAHIMLYQATGDAFMNIPIWLHEGIASLAETFPNLKLEEPLENARATNSMIPMTQLCKAFPVDAANMSLAYAEAESFTRYLYDQYGAPGLNALVNAYADGHSCESGAQAALGVNVSTLYNQWLRSDSPSQSLLESITEMLPWLVLLMISLLTPVVSIINKTRQE